MSTQSTVAEVLHGHATAHPDRPALIYAANPASADDDVILSYRDLDLAARRLAGWLRGTVPAGARVMLLHPPGPGFAVGFAGCLYAGAVAVPVPLPTGAVQRNERAVGIARDCAAALVLTDAATLDAVTAWRDDAGLDGLACAATDRFVTGDRAEDRAGDGAYNDPQWSDPGGAADTPVMVQYTSGSTSQPKGVVISNGNVLTQVDMTRRVMGVDQHTRFGGWLPMHHDLGLIVQLLQPLVLGATSVVMSPFEFLKRPVRWLQMLDRHRVEVSLAPHFAYEICARQVRESQVATLDLSGWAVAGVGAEAVRAGTLTAFAERFAPAGFRAEALTVGYGLAESTVYASVGPRAQRPQVRAVDGERLGRNEFVPVAAAGDRETPRIVSCGLPCEMELRIVDPSTLAPLPDGQVGEVWLRGAGVALGYWDAGLGAVRPFGGTLAGGEDGFLRTGDLGALHDGELYVTGRLKDLMIVRGRNLHPQDIEYEVRTLDPALADRYGAVFAITGPVEEHVAIVQECSAELAGDPERLAGIVARIRDWAAQDKGFRASVVVLLRPGGVLRTPSGKVQRARMRELVLSGSLDTLAEHLDPELRRLYREESVHGGQSGRPVVAPGVA